MNKIIKKVAATSLSLSISVMSFAGVLAAPMTAFAAASITNLTINGQAPGGYCIAGPITIAGHGVTGNQGSTWHLSIDWGDGQVTTDPDGDYGKNESFDFSVTHTPVAASTGLTITVYHATANGNDGPVQVINQCVAAPTTGVVVLAKHVAGGSASASGFSLGFDGANNVTGNEAGATPGTQLTAGTYAITETSMANYTRTSTVCTENNSTVSTSGSINVVAGHNYVCTVTNTYTPPATGTLTVKKVLDNTGGGTAATSSFSFQVNGGSNTAFEADAQNDFSVAPGEYTVTEVDSGAHYSADYDNCSEVTVDSNGTTVCTITNTFHNADPIASDGVLATVEDTAGNGNVAAADADSDTLVYSVIQAPQHGVISSFNVNTGAYTYQPALNYNGTDSFTFKAFDGFVLSNEATVSITVAAGNDAPVANDDSGNTNEDTPKTVDVLDNDTDIDGIDTLTIIGVTDGENGTVTNNGTDVTYTPNPDFNGSDTFTYTIFDGAGGEDTATVTVEVGSENDTPVAQNDAYTTDEDTALEITAPGVLTNDTDSDDGDELTASVVDEPTNGSVTLNSDGSFTYTPNTNYNGTDSFTYVANDGTADSSEATVTITIDAVNDAPAATDQTLTTDQNTSISGVMTGTDVDGDTITFATSSNPANGSITFFDSATGAFTYLPALNFVGGDSFTFKANDGEADSADATVTINTGALDENTLPLCTDGLDNDKDELTDLADPDCAPFNHSDLSVTKSVDNGEARRGDEVTYTIAVTNAGPADASGVTVNDILPSTLVYVSDDASGAYNASTGLWSVGSLTNGASATLHIVATVDAGSGTDIANTASVATGEESPSDTNANNDSATVTFTVGRSGSRSGSTTGSVLGASTGEVLGESCGLYMDQHLRRGSAKNNPEQITKLQAFLNKEMSAALPTTGFFGPLTESSVKQFQTKYGNDILKPWGISAPTGLVYLTTLYKINTIECPELTAALPSLVEWSSNPNAQ